MEILPRFRLTGLLFCPRCRKNKKPEEFGKSKRRATGRQLWCRRCKSAYDATLYQESPERRAAITANNQARARDNLRLMLAYLHHHPCVDCGEKDPIVLEFDHVHGTKDSPSPTWFAGELTVGRGS